MAKGDNLKPYHYKKGQTGNPNGFSRKRRYQQLLDSKIGDEEFVDIVVESAKKKEEWALRHIERYKLGKPIDESLDPLEGMTNEIKRILIPDFDERIESKVSKKRSKSGCEVKESGGIGDIPERANDLGSSGNRENPTDNDMDTSAML